MCISCPLQNLVGNGGANDKGSYHKPIYYTVSASYIHTQSYVHTNTIVPLECFV